MAQFSRYFHPYLGKFDLCIIVLSFDVYLDGSYLISAAVCPIWLLVGMVRALIRPPAGWVAVARVLIPVVTGLIAIVNYHVQETIAMNNAVRVIEACELYRQANGTYPERLRDLVPRYLSSVPRAKYCCSFYGQFKYYGSRPRSLSWDQWPPFGRRVYSFETHEWGYVD